MGGNKVTYPVHYGNSVAVTATEVQKAIAQLKAYNQLDALATNYFYAHMTKLMGIPDEIFMTNDRPDWIQKLEKEWGIR